MKWISLLLSACAPLCAVANPVREKIEFSLPIHDLQFDNEKGVFTFQVSTYPIEGEWQKGLVNVLQKYDEEFHADPQFLGLASLTEIDGSELLFELPLQDGVPQPTEGDLVSVTAMVPVRPFRSIFFPLAQHSIQLMSVTEEPIVTFESVMMEDGPLLEADMEARLVADIRYTAAELRDEMDPVAVNEGSYAGRQLFDVMEAAEVKDLRAFLRYVQLKPRRYMGCTWKVSEVFATWVVSGAPGPASLESVSFPDNLSADEFSTRVRALTPAELQALTENWNAEAERLAALNRHSEARHCADRSLQASQLAGDTEREAWAWFTLGNIHSKNKATPLSEGRKAYEEAIARFDKLHKPLGAAFTEKNLALLLKGRGDFSAARRALSRALKGYDEAMRQSWELGEVLGEHIAEAHYWTGETWREQRKWDEALRSYGNALEYLSVETQEAARLNALTYLSMAQVLEEQGKGEEAGEMKGKGLYYFQIFDNWQEI